MSPEEQARREMRRAARSLAFERGIGYASALFLVRRAAVARVIRCCPPGGTITYQQISDASGVPAGKVREICSHLKRRAAAAAALKEEVKP